jgi:hypothetical protein
MVAGFASERRPASNRNPRPASSEYACLQRRASAPRRIGVPYVTRELIDPEGWL